MKKILVLGAGKSAYFLVSYLERYCQTAQCELTVADKDKSNLREMLKEFPLIKSVLMDIFNDKKERKKYIEQNDVIVSLLPAFMHEIIANDCLHFRKHLVTPSYISATFMEMDKEVREAGLIFLNETGLDPGIDHISAMLILDRIKKDNGKLYSFESYTGGLISKESDNNPWNYKLSWSTMGVITAGQGVTQYYDNNKLKLIPYNRLFKHTRDYSVPGHPPFETYLNRDSIKYKNIYGIDDISCLIRGTLRIKGFCKSWSLLVDLGITDNAITINGLKNKSYKDFLEMFLPEAKGSLKERLAKHLKIPLNSNEINKIEWLGLLSDKKIKLDKATPAQILEILLSEKWKMENDDKDLIVMFHIFKYIKNNKHYQLRSWLTLEGENSQKTAMAKTVGLPMAIAVKLIINDKIKARGVIRPITKDLYVPVMKELEEMGIVFDEELMG